MEPQATEIFIVQIKGVIEVTNLNPKYFRHLESPNSIFGKTVEHIQHDKENSDSCHHFATLDIAFRPVVYVIVRIGTTSNGNVYSKCQGNC